MNIAVFVKEFPKTSETFILSQVEGLLELGHYVTVVALKTPAKGKKGLAREMPFKVVYLGYEGGFIKKILRTFRLFGASCGHPDFMRHALQSRSFLELFVYLLIKTGILNEADVLLFHYGDLAHNFLFLFKKLQITKPCVVVFHAVDVARRLSALPTDEREGLWKYMTLGLPVSGFWRERLERMGCPPEKLRVHHMGVDTGRFTFRKRSINTNRIRLVTAARLIEKKGIDCALESIPLVLSLYPSLDLRYDIIGNGPERARLEAKALALGISDMVTFHGEKPSQAVAEILHSSDVFILPSRTAANGDMEGIPVSLMEAMSCGLAVVSTFHSGIPELVADGVSGLLAEENDVDGIVRALLRLLEEPGLSERIGAGARSTVEKSFNNLLLNRQLERILEEIAEIHFSGRENGCS